MARTHHTSITLLTIFATSTIVACAGRADSIDEPSGESSSSLSGDAPTPPPPPPPPAPNLPVVPIYRGFNPVIGDHVQGTAANEGAPAWVPEGVGFHIFAAPGSDLAPLNRCRVNNTAYHFLSNDAGCEGQTLEGLLGFVATTPHDGASAQLFRCLSPAGSDHLTTVNPGECAAAHYIIEGPQGFAAP